MRMSRIRIFRVRLRDACALAILVLLQSLAAVPSAARDLSGYQYRAAKAYFFVANYHAIPIFALNPIFSSDVIQIDPELIATRGAVCFPALDKKPEQRYKAIAQLGFGAAEGAGLDVNVGAEAYGLASAEIGASATMDRVATVEAVPLSSDMIKRGIFALKSELADLPECRAVREVLTTGLPNHLLVANVLHGAFGFAASVHGAISGSAAAELNVRLRGLKFRDARFAARYDETRQAVVFASGAMTQAVVPAFLNSEEIARLSFYLQGRRGVELEIAVREALAATELWLYEEAWLRVQSIFSDSGFSYERLFHGERMTPMAELSDIEVRSLALLAAADILVSAGPPTDGDEL
jgi:hypothetical protein